MEETNATSTTASTRKAKRKIPCIIVLGMAGAGKTAFISKLVSTLDNMGTPFVVNLDPACKQIPYPADIDIRDTVNYKELMEQYKLGPNSSIVTSFNLFSTTFEKVIQYVDEASDKHNYAIFDTPGQIEVFTWSAGGAIITEALASEFPTIIAYVVDTARNANPVTFMFNMLHSCSMLYKTKLPLILVLNKTDIMKCDYAIEWMQDFMSFQNVLRNMENDYACSLAGSMSFVFDEFYSHLQYCGVSSITGDGFDEFLKLAENAVDEYESDYKPILESRKAKKRAQLKKIAMIQLKKVDQDEMGELAPFSITSDSSEESDN